MIRRNFFATLLAPLVARFAPKPPLKTITLEQVVQQQGMDWWQHYVPYTSNNSFSVSGRFIWVGVDGIYQWDGKERVKLDA